MTVTWRNHNTRVPMPSMTYRTLSPRDNCLCSCRTRNSVCTWPDVAWLVLTRTRFLKQKTCAWNHSILGMLSARNYRDPTRSWLCREHCAPSMAFQAGKLVYTMMPAAENLAPRRLFKRTPRFQGHQCPIPGWRKIIEKSRACLHSNIIVSWGSTTYVYVAIIIPKNTIPAKLGTSYIAQYDRDYKTFHGIAS